MSNAVEIRRNPDQSIDEVIAHGCNLHIEQMSNDGWYMGLQASDGSYWQFWFGSKNRRSHVEFRHTEMSPAEDEKARLKLDLNLACRCGWVGKQYALLQSWNGSVHCPKCGSDFAAWQSDENLDKSRKSADPVQHPWGGAF